MNPKGKFITQINVFLKLRSLFFYITLEDFFSISRKL